MAHVYPFSQAFMAQYYSASSSDVVYNIFVPFVVGILVFVGIYTGIYLYYRNTNKKYEFERTTDIRVANVQAFDQPLRQRNGVRSSTMSDRNNGSPRERVRRVEISG